MGQVDTVKGKHIALFVLACVSLALISALHRRVVYFLDLGVEKPTSFKDHNCTLLGNQKDGPFGSEDIAHIGGGLFLVSAGDLSKGLGKEPISDRKKGAIWIVDLNVPSNARIEEQLRKVKIQDLPSDIAFQPHGLFYSFSTSRLYAVSHGLVKGGERIFIFAVVRLPSGDGSRLSSVGLKFERAVISSDLLEQHGVLNDVVEGSALGEFYVTQWLVKPLPREGQANPHQSWDETLNIVLNNLAAVSPIPFSVVHRCVFKPTLTGKKALDNEAQCEVAASGFMMANGIAVDDARNVYWVVDGKSVRELVRQSDGSLVHTQAVDMPHIGDNIEWDPEQRRLIIGTITSGVKALKKMDGDQSVLVGGSITVVERDNNNKLSKSTDVIVHDGSKLNMISAGGLTRSRVILGSPFSVGVLKCDLE